MLDSTGDPENEQGPVRKSEEARKPPASESAKVQPKQIVLRATA